MRDRCLRTDAALPSVRYKGVRYGVVTCRACSNHHELDRHLGSESSALMDGCICCNAMLDLFSLGVEQDIELDAIAWVCDRRDDVFVRVTQLP